MKAIYPFILAILVVCGCNGQPKASATDSTTGGPPAEPIDSIQRTYHLKDLQRVTLKANGHEIPAWVMDDDPKRREGLMWLDNDNVKEDDGMIFVFTAAEPQSFWMENTVLPLDIIFISDGKKVLNVQQGKPMDKSPLPSKGAAKFVLEMRQGAAKRLGIEPGTPVTIPDTVVAKQ
jgi:uncharacterized membrane protein (UPF0127 family)